MQPDILMLLLLMFGFQTVGLVILLAVMRPRATPPVIIMPTPQPEVDGAGCGGSLIVIALALLTFIVLGLLLGS